jgi:hypothetical protein
MTKKIIKGDSSVKSNKFGDPFQKKDYQSSCKFDHNKFEELLFSVRSDSLERIETQTS